MRRKGRKASNTTIAVGVILVASLISGILGDGFLTAGIVFVVLFVVYAYIAWDTSE